MFKNEGTWEYAWPRTSSLLGKNFPPQQVSQRAHYSRVAHAIVRAPSVRELVSIASRVRRSSLPTSMKKELLRAVSMQRAFKRIDIRNAQKVKAARRVPRPRR